MKTIITSFKKKSLEAHKSGKGNSIVFNTILSKVRVPFAYNNSERTLSFVSKEQLRVWYPGCQSFFFLVGCDRIEREDLWHEGYAFGESWANLVHIKVWSNLKSVLIFFILNHPCFLWFIINYSVLFYLQSKLLFSSFFPRNVVPCKNNSKGRD